MAGGETSHPSSDRRYASSTAIVKYSALGVLPSTAARAVALRATDSAIERVFKSAVVWAGSSKASLDEQLETARRTNGRSREAGIDLENFGIHDQRCGMGRGSHRDKLP